MRVLGFISGFLLKLTDDFPEAPVAGEDITLVFRRSLVCSNTLNRATLRSGLRERIGELRLELVFVDDGSVDPSCSIR